MAVSIRPSWVEAGTSSARQTPDFGPRPVGRGLVIPVERQDIMNGRYLGIAAAAVVAGAAFLLGLSINSSRSSPTSAVVQPTPASASTPNSLPVIASTPPPQLVQIEVTVKQEAGAPQVIEVHAVPAPSVGEPVAAAQAPAGPSVQTVTEVLAASARPSPTPVPQQPAGVDPRGPRAPTAIPAIVTTRLVVTQAGSAGAALSTATPLPTPTPNPCSNRVCASVQPGCLRGHRARACCCVRQARSYSPFPW